MKSQKKPKSHYSDKQEKGFYKDILKGKGSNDWTSRDPKGSSKASWDKSFVIDVGDGDKIRVWEVDGKLTYPTGDPHFALNKLYKKKFATALKNYKKSSSPSIEKVKTQSGKEIYRRTGSSFSGEL